MPERKFNLAEAEHRAPEQKNERNTERAHEMLLQGNVEAREAFEREREAREHRRAEAMVVIVGCMDERTSKTHVALGEPLGAADLFSSPGGRLTADLDPEKGAEAFAAMYGSAFQEAGRAGKEKVVYLTPHTCAEDPNAGCAAFGCDAAKQERYFSAVAEALRKQPGFEDARIVTAMYDTDTEAVLPLGGSSLPERVEATQRKMAMEQGEKPRGHGEEWDRQHAANRIYVGRTAPAWSAHRNQQFSLDARLPEDELVRGVALAITIAKMHSHADKNVPLTLQIDDAQASLGTDVEIIEKINKSLSKNNVPFLVAPSAMNIVRTRTEMDTWRGDIVGQEREV